MPLKKEEVERYSRQLLVQDFGVKGQESVLSSKVLIVGAGGLGCPVALYLAGAGVGTIGVLDYDEVSLDNLHRQVAHAESSVGISKTESLKESILRLNSNIRVNIHNVSISSSNALDIVKDYDIISDCSDNAATRYLVNDACVLLSKVLVSGSALRWEGQLTTYHCGETCPCYRCLFPVPTPADLVTNCSEGGVLGPIVGTIGSLQALEIIKIAAEVGASFAGRLFLFDGLSGRTRTIALRPRDPSCVVCGDNPSVKELVDYEVFCGAGAHDKIKTLSLLQDDERISVEEYRSIRESSTPLLLDTRPLHEFALANFDEAKNVTLDEVRKLSPGQICEKLGVTDTSSVSQLFVICHRGNDSQLAVEVLRELFPSWKVRDIQGGYDMWASIDERFPRY